MVTQVGLSRVPQASLPIVRPMAPGLPEAPAPTAGEVSLGAAARQRQALTGLLDEIGQAGPDPRGAYPQGPTSFTPPSPETGLPQTSQQQPWEAPPGNPPSWQPDPDDVPAFDPNGPRNPTLPSKAPSAPRPPLSEAQWKSALANNPEAQQAYSRLTPEQKQKLDELGRTHPGEGGQADPNLLACLAHGTLTAKDRQGHTTLEHLDRFAHQEVEPPLDREQGLRDLLQELAEPGSNSQGGALTCGAASIQYIHAKNYPADFARVAAGLYARGDGSVEMASTEPGQPGATMRRSPSGLQRDASGRSGLDRVYQASMMDFSNGEQIDYDNNRDESTPRYGKPYQGLYDIDVARGLSGVTGKRQEVTRGVEQRGAYETNLQRQLAAGQNPEVMLKWGGQGVPNHFLVVVSMDGDTVTLRDPYGKLAIDPQNRPPFSFGDPGPARQMMDRGTGLIRMRKEDFYANLVSTVAEAGTGQPSR